VKNESELNSLLMTKISAKVLCDSSLLMQFVNVTANETTVHLLTVLIIKIHITVKDISCITRTPFLYLYLPV